ncbi:MAG: hypothetical protein NXI08_06135 [bacterium]|nr:hypothetical protein [bacterium]
MKYLIFVLPLFYFSCSLFDNEQEYEIDPLQLYGEWYQDEFKGSINLVKTGEFDSTNAPVRLINFKSDNSCTLEYIYPPNNRFGDCEWRIYADASDIYLKIDYDEIVIQWHIFVGELYRIKELNEHTFRVVQIGTKRDDPS